VHSSAYHIYYSSLHVSGNHVPTIGRNCSIYGTLVFVTLYGWFLFCWVEWTATSRPDATHTEWQIPVSHRYSNFSRWWANGSPKHLGKGNKCTKHSCATSWIYLQYCTRMRGQENIKVKQQNFSQKVQPQVPWLLVGCVLSLLSPTLMTDNQPTFILSHTHCFVSNLLQSQPLLSDSWKVHVTLYVLPFSWFTQPLCHVYTIYTWQAKQQNAQFKVTMKTEMYFPNDLRENKI